MVVLAMVVDGDEVLVGSKVAVDVVTKIGDV